MPFVFCKYAESLELPEAIKGLASARDVLWERNEMADWFFLDLFPGDQIGAYTESVDNASGRSDTTEASQTQHGFGSNGFERHPVPGRTSFNDRNTPTACRILNQTIRIDIDPSRQQRLGVQGRNCSG